MSNATASQASGEPRAAAAGYSGFGHGKIILTGEHAVVHGEPALAAGLSVGITAHALPGTGRLRVPAWQLETSVDEDSPVGRALGRLLNEVGGRDLDFTCEAALPPGAGLGSSAALAVAVARAAAAHTGASVAQIATAVAAAESVFHGSASGVDAAACSSGSVGWFQRDQGWRSVPVRQPVKLLVGLSGERRATAEAVQAVGRLVDRSAAARRALTVLGDCTREAAAALNEGDVDALGRIFNLAHGILAGLQVSSATLERMVHGARAAGAIGAKLTGAGRGGAVIALAPSHRSDVLARWRADGFDGFEAVIGGPVP